MAKKATTKQKPQTAKTAVVKEENRKASERQRIKEDMDRLDRLDVESAKSALNIFLASPDWTRYGCRIIVQGQFMENQVQAGILVVKNK